MFHVPSSKKKSPRNASISGSIYVPAAGSNAPVSIAQRRIKLLFELCLLMNVAGIVCRCSSKIRPCMFEEGVLLVLDVGAAGGVGVV